MNEIKEEPPEPTDYELLLRDVMLHPRDLGPRRAVADWYAANGDPDRGEFIHIQCEYEGRHHWGVCPKCRHRDLTVMTYQDYTYGSWCRVCDIPDDGTRRIISPASLQEKRMMVREHELEHRLQDGSEHYKNRTDWSLPYISLFHMHGPEIIQGQPRNEGRIFQWWWHRGFITKVKLLWRDWFWGNTGLFWHPAQNISCPAKFDLHGNWCKMCSGRGYIPRPFPFGQASAITPLNHVTLYHVGYDNEIVYVNYDSSSFTKQKPVEIRFTDWRGTVDAEMTPTPIPYHFIHPFWPGVTIHIPPPGRDEEDEDLEDPNTQYD